MDIATASLEALHRELALVHELIRMTLAYRPEPYPSPRGARTYNDGHSGAYKKLVSLRQQLWDVANKLPYPSNEKLTFDNLPHDIYTEIFSHVIGSDPVGLNDVFLYGPSDAVATVKAMRLTNRRLCEVATPYLMSRVDVEITNASLHRLESIACHPVIGPSIRQLRFRLPFHYSELEKDFRLFARHARRRLDWGCPTDRLGNQWKMDNRMEEDLSEEVDDWRRIARNKKDRSWSTSGDLLEDAFAKYSKGYWEESELLEDDARMQKMFQDISEGLPNLERLVMVDRSWDYDDVSTTREDLEFGDGPSTTPSIKRRDLTKQDVLRLISAPLSWGEARRFGRHASEDNFPVMINILSCLGLWGVKLRDLYIDITAPKHFADVTEDPVVEKGLTQLTEKLEGFRFQMKPPVGGEEAWPQREASEFEDLRTLIDSLLQSRSLKGMGLNLQALHQQDSNAFEKPRSWHVNMLMTPREWPELRQLSLNHVQIHSSKLHTFLGQRKKEMSLSLVNCRVSHGTWHEALDVMHGAVSLGLKVVAIRDCEGAEYDEFGKQYWSETLFQSQLFGRENERPEFVKWNSDVKYTDGHSLCYVTHRTEPHNCSPNHPHWIHADAAVNPFDVDRLSNELRRPFSFQPQA